MNSPLPLSPFPAPPCTVAASRLPIRQPVTMEGFVDEEVVRRMVARSPLAGSRLAFRIAPVSADLVLAAEELDYAGDVAAVSGPWFPLPPVGEPNRVPPPVRRATPPELEEPGLEPAHQGGHRWWLAWIAGVLSTAMIALLALTLAQHPSRSQPDRSAPAVSAAAPESRLGSLGTKLHEIFSRVTP